MAYLVYFVVCLNQNTCLVLCADIFLSKISILRPSFHFFAKVIFTEKRKLDDEYLSHIARIAILAHAVNNKDAEKLPSYALSLR